MSGLSPTETIDDLKPLRKRIIRDITAAILDAYPFCDDGTVLLDYACGSGLISKQLAPYCKQVVGMDANEDAMRRYNLAASNQGLYPDEMKALHLDLSKGDDLVAGQRFDVIVAFHHIPDIATVTKELSRLLVPSKGVLLVVDHVKPNGTTVESSDGLAEPLHDVHHGSVAHPRGFSESDILDAFKIAGLTDLSFEICTDFQKRGQFCEMFIAKGVKAEVSSSTTIE